MKKSIFLSALLCCTSYANTDFGIDSDNIGLFINVLGEVLLGGEIKRGDILPMSGEAYGIKAEEGDLRMHIAIYTPLVKIGNVTSQDLNAYGFYSQDLSFASTNHLNSGGEIIIGNVEGKNSAYGIFNKGYINYRSDEGKMKIGNITAKGGNGYGIYQTNRVLGKGGGYIGLVSSTLEIGKISSTQNVYGIYVDKNSSFELNLDRSSLSMSLQEKSSPNQEAIFFANTGGKISVKLKDSSLFLDGNGGVLNNLCVSGRNTISLVGDTASRSKSRTLIVQYLDDKYLNTSVDFSLFVDPKKKIADKVEILDSAYQVSVGLNLFYDMQTLDSLAPTQGELVVLEDKKGNLSVDLSSYADIDFDRVITKIYKKQDSYSSPTQYYIKLSEKPKIVVSPSAIAQATKMVVGNYLAFMGGVGMLDKRMGELKNNPDTSGMWVRVAFGGEGLLLPEFDYIMHYASIQAGGDTRQQWGSNSVFLGITASYIGSLDSSDSLTSLNGGELGVYGILLDQRGFFLDTQAKFGFFGNAPMSANIHNNPLVSSYSLGLSAEIGKRFGAGKKSGVFGEISAKSAFGYLYTPSFELKKSNGAFLEVGGNSGIVSRNYFGGKIGYNIARGEHISDIFFGGYLAYHYLHSTQVDFATKHSTLQEKFPAYHTFGFLFSFGTNVEINKNSKFYADIDAGGGGGFYDMYKINLGVRLNF